MSNWLMLIVSGIVAIVVIAFLLVIYLTNQRNDPLQQQPRPTTLSGTLRSLDRKGKSYRLGIDGYPCEFIVGFDGNEANSAIPEFWETVFSAQAGDQIELNVTTAQRVKRSLVDDFFDGFLYRLQPYQIRMMSKRRH